MSTLTPLRLNYNENTAGCSPVVLEALQRMTREDVAIYPDAAAVTTKVESWFGVQPGWVEITNGLDEGISLVAQCGALHYRGTTAIPSVVGMRTTPEAILVEPTFEVYDVAAESVGARIVRIAPEPDFAFPLNEILAAITPSTRIVYLTDPNNPTGLGIPAGAVREIADSAPHAIVLVDEAYADFSGRTLVGPLLDEHHNLAVGRTFAKGHGLAGLRVGAVVAHPELIDQLRRLQLPFSVNIYAMTALSAALESREYLDWYVGQSARSRDAIYAFCRRHGFTFWPSEANFVLFRVGERATQITSALAARGIQVRDKSAAPGCAGCIRLTAGVVEHTDRALSAMEEILASRPR